MLSEKSAAAPFALRAEIDDLQARYAQTIDDDRLEEWPAYFTEHAPYEIVPRENVELGYDIPIMYCRNRAMMTDRVLAIRKASLYGPHRYRHIVSRSIVLSRADDTVTSVTPFAVFQVRTGPVDFGTVEMYAIGEYRDVLALSAGGPQIAKRTVVVDNSTIRTLLVTPL